MGTKRYLYPIAALALAAWMLSFSSLPERLSTGFSMGIPSASRRSASERGPEYGRLNEIYVLSFSLPKTTAGSIGVYLPDYKPVTLETAEFYAGLFGMQDNGTGTEDCYIFESAEGCIYIDKNRQHLRYAAKSGAGSAVRGISDEEAIQKALEFIEDNLLLLSYDEVLVRFDGEFYEVMFLNQIANIHNYAFPTKVLLDGQGWVTEMDYYFFTYKSLGSCRIKSMWEAFGELPLDFPEDVRIPLSRCRLVYYYENSIVQPAYLFEGDYPGGKSFASFVKASVYSQAR